MIAHYKNCTANYPEKPAGEPPQHIIEPMPGVRQCADCGAYEVITPRALSR